MAEQWEVDIAEIKTFMKIHTGDIKEVKADVKTWGTETTEQNGRIRSNELAISESKIAVKDMNKRVNVISTAYGLLTACALAVVKIFD